MPQLRSLPLRTLARSGNLSQSRAQLGSLGRSPLLHLDALFTRGGPTFTCALPFLPGAWHLRNTGPLPTRSFPQPRAPRSLLQHLRRAVGAHTHTAPRAVFRRHSAGALRRNQLALPVGDALFRAAAAARRWSCPPFTLARAHSAAPFHSRSLAGTRGLRTPAPRPKEALRGALFGRRAYSGSARSPAHALPPALSEPRLSRRSLVGSFALTRSSAGLGAQRRAGRAPPRRSSPSWSRHRFIRRDAPRGAALPSIWRRASLLTPA